MARKTKAPLGASLIVVSSVFYASYGIWTKLMGNYFDGYTASALRSLIVLAILLPIAAVLQAFEPVNLKQNWRYLAALFVASLFTWGPLYYAILHVGVGMSLAINYACIVIGTFFFSWLIAGERLTKDKLLAGLLGLGGIALIFSPNVSTFGWLALLAAAISGFSVGANTVFLKRIKYSATQSTLALWTASALANFFMAFALGRSFPTLGLHMQWFYLVCFAVASVVASWCLVSGVKLIEAGAAGILGLLEIVFGVVFGVVFFHERPSLVALLGVAVIICAAAVPYVKDYNANRGTL